MILEEFKNKTELFKYLKSEKSSILAMKKSVIKHTDSVCGFSNNHASKSIVVNKADSTITKTIIGNTYNWMDSHDDVHLDGSFKKSINERKNQVFHLHDHEFKLVAQVGDITNIEEKKIEWSKLGVDKLGSTEALHVESEIKKVYNPFIFEQYNKGSINQHSVGMYYIKLSMAINSDDETYKEEKIEWDKHIDKLGNKQKAIDKGYFFPVYEAKLIEVSAVLLGSNELTPTIEPSTDTQKIEPSTDTQKINTELLINYLKK